MLYYVATYPRSGSGLLRYALRYNFGLITANGYAPIRAPEPTAGPDLAYVDDPEIEHVPRQLLLVEPALPRLTPEVRERLAARPERLFVKTHERPHPQWFPGEHVIQMVRHPGAAMTSFCNLKRRTAPHILLENFVGRPDWASYHQDWLAAEVPTLRLRYEDMFENPALVDRLSGFLGIAPVRTRVMTLPEAVVRAPERNPGLGVDGWRGQMSAEAYQTLRRINAQAAARLGYELAPTLAEIDEAPAPPRA